MLPEDEAISQAALDATEYVRVPPPVFATETDCAARVVPPTVNAKLRLDLDSDIAGGTTTFPAMILIASEPPVVVTPIVAMPTPKLAGRSTVMSELLPRKNLKRRGLRIKAVTWHAAHCVPEAEAPPIVIVVPA